MATRIALSPSIISTLAENAEVLPTSGLPISAETLDGVLYKLVQFQGPAAVAPGVKLSVGKAFTGLVNATGLFPRRVARETSTGLLARMARLKNDDVTGLDEASPLRRTIEELRDPLSAPSPDTEKGRRLARHDTELRIASGTMQKFMSLDRKDAERQVDLLEGIADALRVKCEKRHARCLQDCFDLIDRTSPEAFDDPKTTKALKAITDKAAKDIDGLANASVDAFIKANGANYGFTGETQDYEYNTNYEYCVGLLKYTAKASAASSLLATSVLPIPGAGPAASFLTGFLSNYFVAASVAGFQAQLAEKPSDIKHFTFKGGKVLVPTLNMERQVEMERYLDGVDTVFKEGMRLYADPNGTASEEARRRVGALNGKGYAGDGLASVSLELLAVAQYESLIATPRDGATPSSSDFDLTSQLPDALTLSAFLNTYADRLPDVPVSAEGGPPSPQQMEGFVRQVLAVVHETSGQTSELEPAQLVDRILARSGMLIQEVGEGDEAYARRHVTPGPEALYAGSPPLMAMVKSSGRLMRELAGPALSSSEFVRAQRAGATANAAWSLPVGVAFAIGGGLAVGAATAAGGPAAGVGAGFGVAGLRYLASKPTNMASAHASVTQYRRGTSRLRIMSQIDARKTNPMLGDKEKARIREERIADLMDQFTPVHEQVGAHIELMARSTAEDQMVKILAVRDGMATGLFEALEAAYGTGSPDGTRLLAHLAGRQIRDDAKRASVDVRRATIELADKRTGQVRALAEGFKTDIGATESGAERLDAAVATAESLIDSPTSVTTARKNKSRYGIFYKDGDAPSQNHQEIDGFRRYARDLVDARLDHDPDCRFSTAEWEAVLHFLRTSHSDAASEAWITATEARLGDRLERDSTTPHHLDDVGPAGAGLSRERRDVLGRAWDEKANEIAERRTVAVDHLKDLAHLKARNYDAIRDDTGLIARSLRTRQGRLREVRRLKTTNPVEKTALRGFGNLATFFGLPGSKLGAAALVVGAGLYAAGGASVVGLDNPLAFHAGDVSFNVASLAGTEYSQVPRLFTPAAALGSVGQGSAPNAPLAGFDKDPRFLSDQAFILRKVAGAFGEAKAGWDGATVDPLALVGEVMKEPGRDKSRSRMKQSLKLPADFLLMSGDEQVIWAEEAVGSWTSRFKNLRYNLNWKRFKQQQQIGKQGRFQSRNLLKRQIAADADLAIAARRSSLGGAPHAGAPLPEKAGDETYWSGVTSSPAEGAATEGSRLGGVTKPVDSPAMSRRRVASAA